MNDAKQRGADQTLGIEEHLEPPAPKQATDDIVNALFSSQAISLVGGFVASEVGRGLSRAPQFQADFVPVTAWFSATRVVPVTACRHRQTLPLHVAIRFHLADGSDTDLIAHSFKALPTRTFEEFGALLSASATGDALGVATSPAERYRAAHPHTKTFLKAALPMPRSYGTVRYFGMHTFRFTSAFGRETLGRYRLEPSAGEQYLPSCDARRAPSELLNEEIRRRSSRQTISFELHLQLPEQGDPLDDPSVAWPDTCLTLPLGTIALTHVASTPRGAQHPPRFASTPLPSGIKALNSQGTRGT